MTIEPIIKIENVSFTYLGDSSPSLKDINLEIDKGDFVLILGPSSSGKSTLANLLNGSIPNLFEGDLQGDVIISGCNTKEVALSELASKVGLVFQDPESQLINVMVKDEIYFGPENLIFPREKIIENASRAMKLVEITSLMDEGLFQLSGGQKQKVAIAAILAMEPEIIVLDQPTANLDPQTKLDVFNILEKLNKDYQMTVVVIEHEVDHLARMINKVVVMKDGRILAVGEPRQIFSKEFSKASKELGLWTPQVSELAIRAGNIISFEKVPLTVDEAIPSIDSALKSQTIIPRLDYAITEYKEPDELPLIEVKDLTFIYAANERQALSNVNLRVFPKDFLSILGKNGSGKSTLAKVLMKINKVPRGKVFIKGKDIVDLSNFELTDTIGYVFQSPDHQFVADTVYDEVAYSLRVRKTSENIIEERVNSVLDLFNLSKHKEASPFSLSMGQRRLLSVATMLILDQDVIILDEPTIGQDQTSSDLLMGYLDKLNKSGKTIIIISHDMRLVSKWVDRAFVMSESNVLYDGLIDNVFIQESLLEKACLLAPPVSTLMHKLDKSGHNLPKTVYTVDNFMKLFSIEGE
ncbi:MAG: ABC transporter ATP-binding protein [Bacillota bacterium]|jgi:energy-coupling factor transporter ATP-binding protein EcfA2